ncbi:MAG: glycoside hydrolase family 99-like domain-containing protein [Planctomycetota bacterium]|nr:glycoside hydrolase family 99-like domain-containing protein [Planctomycetota bacterium]
MRFAAYVYPGWHPIPERDAAFHPGFTEWELVAACRPRFAGHAQPKLPLLGSYDDRDPAAWNVRVPLARAAGIDAFVWGHFWCRGKRVFEDALDLGFLGSEAGAQMPFAVMWANRMPRRVLPVRQADAPVLDPERLVPTDVDDFVALIAFVAERYFARANYLTVGGVPYFSIYDSTFFVRELGVRWAREAIMRARAWLRERGFAGLHLAAIEPNPETLPLVRELGFDSVTHYVHLPDWKGPREQDYSVYAAARAAEWSDWATTGGLPYMPSIATGWDASPRGADFGTQRPDRYPWSPVVTGEHPERFHEALSRAMKHADRLEDPLVFLASWNEWSEGHYLEPDERFGHGWLHAVRSAR